jgi:DNA-binding phage protein
MDINKAIKVLMVEKQISAIKLAKLTGFNRSTIFRTVGPDANPKVQSLTVYAKALGVKVSDIILLAEKYGVQNESTN